MSETDNKFLDAYFDKMMEEHGVDLQDEQAIRASQAMSDIDYKFTEITLTLLKEAERKGEVYIDALTEHGSESKITTKAKSEVDAIRYQIKECPCSEFIDRYFHEKMEEHGVDLEDEQAQRAIRAMNKYLTKVEERETTRFELIEKTVETNIALRKRAK